MEKKRVALYCRVGRNADEWSLRAQQKQLMQYAAGKGYEIVGEFLEIGMAPMESRHGIQLIKDMAARKGIDVVLAVSTSRISRETLELLGFVEQLDGWGVSFETVRDNLNSEILLQFFKLYSGYTL